jgi:nicotinamidase-related amidase
MKEEYLNSSNFEKAVDDLVAEITGHHYRQKHWILHPEKAALLVLDMQNYFLEPKSHAFTPSAPAIVPNINKLLGMARKHKMAVIFTRHVNDASNAGRMGRWWRDLIAEDSCEARISETIGREDFRTGRLEDGRTGGREDEKTERREDGKAVEMTSPVRDDSMVGWYDSKIIVKSQYDAFYKTDLEEYLQSKQIEQVIITGVLTNLCCETTARSAFVRGFEVLFPIDATAAYNRDFHLSTFRNLGFGFCPILTTSDLINSLNETK